MNSPTPAVRWLPAAGAALLLALLLPGEAAAQPLPPVPGAPDPNSETLRVALGGESGFAQVPYNGQSQTQITVYDLSHDSGAIPSANVGGSDAKRHSIELRIENIDEIQRAGWQVALGASAFQLYGGQSATYPVYFQTTPQLNQQQVTAVIVAELYDPATSARTNATINLTGEVERYSRASAKMLTFPQVAGQFDVVRYEVRIVNDAVYPDVFTVEADIDKEGYILISPPSVYVPPLESRTFNVTVRTPYGKLYELGEGSTLAIRMTSAYSGASFPVTGVLRVEGIYVSTSWWPLLAMAAVSAAVVGRGARQRAALRRLEKGRPRRVEPAPRQAVLLAALKRDDPEAYKRHRERMAAIYAERRRLYREERKRIRASDREEVKRSKAEYKAARIRQKEERRQEKLRRKAEKAEAKARRKAERKAAKAQAKIDLRQAKAEAKELKKLEKELGRKRKKLEKARAKAAKAEAREARAAARQAKADEKARRKAAKAAAKAGAPPPADEGRDGNP